MHVVPLLLITVAVGYWVLTISQSQQKPLGLIGRILGGIIILLALGSLICGAICKGTCGSPMCSANSSKCGVVKAGCHGQAMEKAPEAK